jgi:hypothetical protein
VSTLAGGLGIRHPAPLSPLKVKEGEFQTVSYTPPPPPILVGSPWLGLSSGSGPAIRALHKGCPFTTRDFLVGICSLETGLVASFEPSARLLWGLAAVVRIPRPAWYSGLSL